MHWKKLGKIFDPTQHQLACGCSSYAQSPQALLIDDFVRIYFSTRAVDPSNGKFLSHISFVDMDRHLRSVRRVANAPVIPLGPLGCFDEHGIFPMNVFRHRDAVYGYTCGWSRRVSVSVETSIGLAISRDNGTSFERQGDGPILSSSLHEPMLVGDPFVSVFEGLFHMWYIYGLRWIESPDEGAPQRVYKIAHATSLDGITWRKEGREIIADKLGVDECQALPTVTRLGDRYHMWFCYREATDFRTNPNRGYRLGHAYSSDLVSWFRDDEELGLEPTPGDWDAEMICYPHVFQCEGRVYLLYNGSNFGRLGFGAALLTE